MSIMRAKMQINAVKTVEPWPGTDGQPQQEVTMSAVCGNWNDQGDGEDNTYARFTPQAHLNMTINNPALLGKLKPGQKLYIDFSVAEEE